MDIQYKKAGLNRITKKRKRSTLHISLSAILLSACLTDAVAGDAIENILTLDLQQSVSTAYNLNELATFYNDISAFYSIPCFQEKFIGDILINGYTNFPTTSPFYLQAGLGNTPLDSIGGFTVLTTHNTANGALTEVDSLRISGGKGFTQVAISPDASRPFFTTSSFESVFPIPPLRPEIGPYTLSVYEYHQDGTLNKTPLSSIDFSSLNSQAANNMQLTYNGAVNFSYDGKYLFYTQTLGDENGEVSRGPDGVGNKGSQVLGILKVGLDGSLTKVAEVAAPNNGDFFYSQPNIISFKKNEFSDEYKLIVGYVGFVPNNVGSFHGGMLNSYDFNSNTNTLTQTGSQPIPMVIQGLDINSRHDRVVVIGDAVSSSGKSLKQNPVEPFANNAPDSNKNFRVYNFDENVSANALSYNSGHDLGQSAWNVRWSPNGRWLALTTTSEYKLPGYAGLFMPKASSTEPVANGTSTVILLRYSRLQDQFKLQAIKPAASYAASLAWNADSSMLAVTGQDSTVLKGLQLYKVNH